MIPKLKAWLKYDKEMKNVLAFDTRGHSFLGIEGPHVTVDGWCDNFEVGKQAVIMQSTGLKDKNGVDIFEGDVLKNTRNGKIRRVHWNPSCASFQLSKHGIEESKVEYWSLSNPQWSYEIIGNIYENPELLEQADEN